MHFCEASPTLALDNVKKEAILRDFLNFWSSQHQKRSNSARLPQFLKLASSKNEAVLRDFFQDNGKLSAELTASCQCVLQFFQSMSLKYCACHEKVVPGHTKCCTCHTKSSSQNWRSDVPNATPLKESAPWPPNISDEYVSCISCITPATENASFQILFKCPTPARFLEMLGNPHVLLTFDKVPNPLHRPHETTSERPKVVRTCCVFYIPDPNWFRSRGGGSYILIMYEHKGGVNPLTFCQKCMGTRGG